MKKWEYLMLDNKSSYPTGKNDQDLLPEDKLNQLGQEGWELISVKAYGFYFKRELTNA